jgi:uncharacterized membrane protein
LAVGSALWVAAIVVAPRAIASGERVVSTAAAGIYSAGRFICHQRPDRCFRIDGRPMPVCARCTGLYVAAAAAGPLALLFGASLSSSRARRILVLAAIPTLSTWSLEYAGVAHVSNAIRAVCALPLGFVAGWLVIGATTIHAPRRFDEDRRGHTDPRDPEWSA